MKLFGHAKKKIPASYSEQFPIHLKAQQKLAFMMSPRLGDSLLSMVVINNLYRNNFPITVFSDQLNGLNDWFPWAHILPKPGPTEIREILLKYDLVLHDFNASVIENAEEWHPNIRILEHSPYNWLTIAMVDIQVQFCQHELLLKNVVRENNIIAPAGLIHRKFKQRVVIHPTSSDVLRQWLPVRFFELAQWLQRNQYEPIFIVAKHERKDWLWLEEQGFALPEFASLSDLASSVYESGWFIGNDSGIGHLASNLGIPTLTLGMRKKMLQRWRPAWAPGIVILPPKWLITRPIKQHGWKYFIFVPQVIKAFKKLTSA